MWLWSCGGSRIWDLATKYKRVQLSHLTKRIKNAPDHMKKKKIVLKHIYSASKLKYANHVVEVYKFEDWDN